jgi:hypothetical protein
MEIDYIEFDDEEDPRASVNNPGVIRITFSPRAFAILLPNAGKYCTVEDQDLMEQMLKLAYYQGKELGKELK